jgi:hypothetical protein
MQLLRSVLCLTAISAKAAFGQDAPQTLPNNYTLTFRNELVRVIRVRYAPHEKLPVNAHPDKPTLYVYLTDSGPVRFSHVEEHAFTVTRAPLKAGSFRLSPGRLEKHAVKNLGDIPTEFLRVELLRVPLGFQRNSARDRGPFDLSHTLVATAFPGPYIQIDRVIAAGSEKIEIGDNSDAALLVALSPSRVGDRTLNTGDVLWLDAHRKATVTAPNLSPAAHLLRVAFLPVSN